MPFEVGEDAFHKARSEKIEKYSDLVDWARTQYRRVNFGIVSLGSWDVANYETMKMLRVSKKYSKLFVRLCTVDAIKGSLSIWRNHCEGVPN